MLEPQPYLADYVGKIEVIEGRNRLSSPAHLHADQEMARAALWFLRACIGSIPSKLVGGAREQSNGPSSCCRHRRRGGLGVDVANTGSDTAESHYTSCTSTRSATDATVARYERMAAP